MRIFTRQSAFGGLVFLAEILLVSSGVKVDQLDFIASL
jgi:hypothetical protein